MKLLKTIYQGFIDGWNDNIKTLVNDNNINQDILDEISTLEIIIERQYTIGSALEKELNSTYDLKKRVVILNKLNVLDKQTLKNKQRLNKLKSMV